MAHGIKTASIMMNLVELNYDRGQGIAKNNLFHIGTTTIQIKTLDVMTMDKIMPSIMTHGIKTSSGITSQVEINYGRGRGKIQLGLIHFGATTIKIKTFSVMDIIMANGIKTSSIMKNLVELNYGRGP